METGNVVQRAKASPQARVIRALIDGIQSGGYAVGSSLPSMRELAKTLAVDRGTLQRAMHALEAEGFVRRQGRSITVVAAGGAANGLAANAVAVLTLAPQRIIDHRAEGWGEYISLGAMQAIQDAGLNTVAMHPHRLNPAELRHLVEARPFGVVFTDLLSDPGEETLLRTLRDAGIRLAVYGDDPAWCDYDRVSSDQEAGSYELTHWLIRQGRRRILCFWQQDWLRRYWLPARRAGYERALREAGLAPLPVGQRKPQPGETVNRDAFEAVSREAFEARVRLVAGYLAEHLSGPTPVDAIMTGSDGDVPYTAAACRLFGKEPGRDVLIAGYDNYWSDCPERQYEPSAPCATVDKRNAQIGSELVRLLVDRAEKRLPSEPQRRLVAPALVEVGEAGGTK